MPTSLIGLLLFISLLTPGFIYLERRERWHPGIKYTTFRETSLVVVTSVLSLAVAAAILGLARAISPGHTPNVGAYVRVFTPYTKAHYREALVWGAVLLSLACVAASVAAIPPAFLGRVPFARVAAWADRRRGDGSPIVQKSGWGVAFDPPRTRATPRSLKVEKWITVTLTDGTLIYGMLGSKATQIEETDDRDLVIAEPYKIRPSGVAEWPADSYKGTLVVSAKRISYFNVQYVGRSAKSGPDSMERLRRKLVWAVVLGGIGWIALFASCIA